MKKWVFVLGLPILLAGLGLGYAVNVLAEVPSSTAKAAASNMVESNKVPKDKLKEAKELLADTALTQLEKGDDFEGLADIKVEFGYIYLRGNSYESLFKVMTDKKSIYFAAQQGKLMRLQFSEAQFREIVQQMEILHGKWK